MPVTRSVGEEQPERKREERRELRVDELLRALSLQEKVAMLSGHGFFEQVAEDGRYCGSLYHIGAGNERLGIPPLLFCDGPRGIAMGRSTCFPVPMARGASFDTDLERRIGDAIGRELRAHGGNLFGGVCINLPRHPAWGRAQESYGEDPFLLGEMGAALVRGVQHHNVVATPKHFAANSMENARFTVDVKIDERVLREVYLPHFKRCIDAGAGALMSAYNQINGAYCGHNRELLCGILRRDWGFDGYVYSDFVLGCRGWDAFSAGLDVEAPDTVQFGDKLVAALERGDVALERLDEAVRRVLRSLFRTLERDDPEIYGPEQVACEEHVMLALEAAEKSIVLLRNEDVLPWDVHSMKRLLVLGRLADEANLGDFGSSRVYPPAVVTPLEGLRARCGGDCEIAYDVGDDLERVGELAARADAVLVVAGYTHADEGEFIPGGMAGPGGGTSESVGGDRVELGLGERQEELILAAAEANPKTVVAVMAGSAVLMERWRERVAAILMLWYPGMQGGRALAGVLFGDVSPSGRLPFSIPERAEDLPFFDRDATSIRYDLWHGYTLLERDEVRPAYAFGFGLCYTRFELSGLDLSLATGAEAVRVSCEVTNTGERAAECVLQTYAGWAEPAVDQPRKRLCGFCRVALAAGECRRVRLEVAVKDLAFFDVKDSCWRLGRRAWRFHVGTSSADDDALVGTLELTDRSWSVSQH